MRSLLSILCFAFVMCSQGTVYSQNLDSTPYRPGIDPDIDMYLSSWKESMPVSTHGSLIERNILTQGDPLKPVRRGAVLKYLNRVSHATLAPYNATAETTLRGEQKIIFVLTGTGIISGGGETHELSPNISALIPAGLPFVIRNTDKEPLTMYLVNEPAPDGFKPNSRIIIRNENTLPILSTDGHWCHIVKRLFSTRDGLSALENVLIVAIDPMTIPHPHSHGEGVEEIWLQINGRSLCFLGKQIRWQEAGTGYMVPPNGNTPHSNINVSDEQVRFLYLARFKDR